MREEIIGNQRLILGNSSDVVELVGYADVTLTDPPYGIAGSVDAKGKGAYTDAFDDTREYVTNTVIPIIQ